MNVLGYISIVLFLLWAENGDCRHSDCPRFIPRTQWSNRAPRNPQLIRPLHNVEFVVIHHTGGPQCMAHGGCANQMRSVQVAHMATNMYNDIGYNFAIGGNGLVYEARGWHTEGEFAPNFNSRALTVAFIGNFGIVLPNQRQLNAFKALIKCGIHKKVIPKSVTYIAHKQVRKTTCPGQALYNYLRTWPNFERNPK